MTRPPHQPDRDSIPLHELEDYDNVVGRFARRLKPGGVVPHPFMPRLR